jgi:hypothetical protein
VRAINENITAYANRFLMVHIIGLSGLLFWTAAAATPEQRAADYLAVEVPKWARENHCYSCHNNGDAARALFAARRAGLKVADEAIADTVAWLRTPAKWGQSQGAPGGATGSLANVQFAAALLESGSRRELRPAAETLAQLQEADGSWKVDADGLAGAPATYGRALATYMARRVTMRAGLRAASDRAGAWLRKAQPANVVDAAAIALALPDRRDCVEFLKRTRWDEAFDTALAILALDRAGERAMVERGRASLLKLQQEAGGWQETTRPPGGVSYAEHISTTAWALYALLETNPKPQ